MNDPLANLIREMRQPRPQPQGMWPWPDPTNERIKTLEAQIQAVRKLHSEVEGLHCHTVCSHRSCIDDSGDQHRYPCPTIRALDGDSPA